MPVWLQIDSIRPDQVQSAVDYYVDYKAEIDDQIRRNQEDIDPGLVPPVAAVGVLQPG
jgi:hypothetical protein